MTELVEAEVVEEPTEIATVPPPANLFHTSDPVLVLERATATANALRDVIRQQGLAVKIQNKWHITVEGWQTLGAMLGVTPVCEWTKEVEGGWEARVVAQTLDGRIIGAAEAQCLTTEKRGPWKSAEGYAVRSMAQTRATSKALASVLRFVATLAGYEGTPAEEMAHVQAQPEPPRQPIDKDKAELILAAIKGKQMSYKQINLMLGACGIDALRAKSKQAVSERLEGLTEDEAKRIEEWFNRG